jgi:hypothetical protein
MWSKRVSELWDIARISELKWHTDLSRCYKAPSPSDFSSLVAQNSSSNKNIAIVGTLDVDINRLTTMVTYMSPLFFELRTSLISFRIFVRCQRLIARNVADGFLLFSFADTF